MSLLHLSKLSDLSEIVHEVKYKTGLCDKFCKCLLTLVGILNYQGKINLKIRIIL